MHTKFIVVFLGCAAVATLSAQDSAKDAGAGDAAKGAALLADARKAVGGDERLRAVKTLDVKGDFTRVAGQTNISGELEVRIELPDKLRRDEDLSPPGGGPAIVRTEVLNGSSVWEEASGGGGGFFLGRFGRGQGRGDGRGGGRQGGRAAIDPAQLEEAQRRARQTELARFQLVWLLAVDSPVNWIGTAEAPDGKADVLEMTPRSGPVTRLFLDQTSHVPLMITWQGGAPQLFFARRGGRGAAGGDVAPPPPSERAAQATLQMTLGNYKTVNGIRLPHLITRGVNDMTIEEWKIDSYRVNASFKADVFTK
jgi:hypothetical protein